MRATSRYGIIWNRLTVAHLGMYIYIYIYIYRERERERKRERVCVWARVNDWEATYMRRLAEKFRGWPTYSKWISSNEVYFSTTSPLMVHRFRPSVLHRECIPLMKNVINNRHDYYLCECLWCSLMYIILAVIFRTVNLIFIVVSWSDLIIWIFLSTLDSFTCRKSQNDEFYLFLKNFHWIQGTQ